MPSFTTSGMFAGRPSNSTIRNLVLGQYRAGKGTVAIREGLRAQGHHQGTSNNAISGIIKEIKALDKAARGATHLGDKSRPKPIKVGLVHGRRYIYYGIAHLWATDPDSGQEVPWEKVPVSFSEDFLLTGEQIRGRIEAIGEQVAAHGGTNVKGGPGYGIDAFVHHVTVQPTQESAGDFDGHE